MGLLGVVADLGITVGDTAVKTVINGLIRPCIVTGEFYEYIDNNK